AVLQKKGHEVRILDCLIRSSDRRPIDQNFVRSGLSDSEIFKQVTLFKPDMVGISCMFTSYFKNAHDIARIIKGYDKDILVVFGGAHASTFPELVMKDENVDAVVVGEGEVTICEMLERHSLKKDFSGVKGLLHRASGVVKREEPREFIQNLDELPFPAWGLLEKDLEIIKQESRKSKFLMRQPLGRILTSRGCPNDCYFCSVKLVWARMWRGRSAKNIVDEIEFLKNKHGYREFHFVDDNSSVSKKRMHEICDELLSRKLNIKLATPTGIAVGTLDREILAKMKRAGFYRLCFGIESGDPQTQKIIKKRLDLDKARSVIAEANKLGFWTSGTFIIGFPHETMKEIRNTIDFAKTSNMDFVVIYLLTPQPGTEVYNIFKQQGLINLDVYMDPHSEDWYKISITYCNGFKSTNFSNKELQNILSGAYKEFIIYKLFSLQTYINIIRKIHSLEDLRYMFGLMTIPMRMLFKIILGKSLSNISLISKNKKTLTTIE
ncbi:MAG: radical SAM protein, partial [Candidatus Omnitrophica bacterium]|nr:radical SAM protein [Candidatus Omnitrophota bacterium]